MQIKASAYNMIEKDGKVLLFRFKSPAGWIFPGGAVEEGELITEAAIREVKEESGYDVELKQMLPIQEYINDEGILRLRFFFIAEITGGEFSTGKDESGYVWMNKDELSELSEQDFYKQNFYFAIKDYLEYKAADINLLRSI